MLVRVARVPNKLGPPGWVLGGPGRAVLTVTRLGPAAAAARCCQQSAAAVERRQCSRDTESGETPDTAPAASQEYNNTVDTVTSDRRPPPRQWRGDPGF